jgi:hypothetical protein
MENIQDDANDFEKDRNEADAKASRFHIGDVFLEVAIVFSSLAILTKRKPVFFAGGASALIGIVYAATGFIGA